MIRKLGVLAFAGAFLTSAAFAQIPGGGGGGGSGCSGTIGASLPTCGNYNALNVSSALRGWSGIATGPLFAGAVAIVDGSGNQITSFGVANASVAPTGAAVPASATYVGILSAGNLVGWNGAVAQSGTWTVQPGNTANTTPWLFTISQGGNPAQVSAGGALKVDGSAVTQPVSAASLPLPAGASTAANQTAVQGAANSPGAAATSSILLGGVFRSTNPAPTNGQQLAFGIDATGGAYVSGLRPKVATATFTPAASGTYVSGNNIGGKLTFATGLPTGTPILVDYITVAFVATSISAAAPGLNGLVFVGNPATTFTDAATPAINAADVALLARAITLGGLTTQSANLWAEVTTAAQSIEAVVDASGNIYVALQLSAAPPTYGASPGTATVYLGYRY